MLSLTNPGLDTSECTARRKCSQDFTKHSQPFPRQKLRASCCFSFSLPKQTRLRPPLPSEFVFRELVVLLPIPLSSNFSCGSLFFTAETNSPTPPSLPSEFVFRGQNKPLTPEFVFRRRNKPPYAPRPFPQSLFSVRETNPSP